MKPIAKFGELPFNVGGICVFAATDHSAQEIDKELYIINECSTRMFDLVDSDSTTVYQRVSMVGRDKNRNLLDLSATAQEIASALGRDEFAVKVYDATTMEALGFAYKFFTHKVILTNGNEVQTGKYATKYVAVVVPVESISLNKNSSNGPIGGSETLVATVLPENATNKSVVWSSTNDAVLTVSNSGLVTLVGNGSATVNATTVDGSKVASCAYVVNTPVTGVTLSKTSSNGPIGGTELLVATVLPDNAANKDVVWSSTNDEVLTVSNAGLVTLVGEGNASVIVTTVDGSHTAECTYVVSAA